MEKFIDCKVENHCQNFSFRDPKTERQFQEIGKFFICVDVCEDGFTGKRVAFIVPMVLIGMTYFLFILFSNYPRPQRQCFLPYRVQGTQRNLKKLAAPLPNKKVAINCNTLIERLFAQYLVSPLTPIRSSLVGNHCHRVQGWSKYFYLYVTCIFVAKAVKIPVKIFLRGPKRVMRAVFCLPWSKTF